MLQYSKRDQKGSTSSGCVALSFSFHDDTSWKLTVEDDGIGIAPEDCTRIFEEF